MKVINTYNSKNTKERKEKQTQIHNRCVLLLNEMKEART